MSVPYQKYVYPGGYFINYRNMTWEEIGQQQPYYFRETNVDKDWTTLFDESRNIYVSLPIKTGRSYYRWASNTNWDPLYGITVTRLKRDHKPTSIPDLPGCSFAYISFLLDLNFSVIQPTPISKELMLAIFWEESPFFNNIFQVGAGTAVGYGQTEPYEFYRFDANGTLSQLAMQGGYLVNNLPPRHHYAPKKARILKPLDDYTSVRAACAMLRDLFARGITTKIGILNAYGTVSAPSAGHLSRPTIIQNWQNCEQALKLAIPLLQTQPQVGQNAVVQALNLSKSIPAGKYQQFLNILFP